jgi:acetate---CoA ligase (ADP-forming)
MDASFSAGQQNHAGETHSALQKRKICQGQQVCAGSHTGALAGISEVSQSAFKGAGIIEVNHPGEMFPVAESLALLPMLKENSIAILADGGGHATIAADYLTELGINSRSLKRKPGNKLAAILPANASLANPIDVAGGADRNPAMFSPTARKSCWLTKIYTGC